MTVGPWVPGKLLSRDCICNRPFPESEKLRNDFIQEVSEVVNIILERRKAQAMASGNSGSEVAVPEDQADASDQEGEGSDSRRHPLPYGCPPEMRRSESARDSSTNTAWNSNRPRASSGQMPRSGCHLSLRCAGTPRPSKKSLNTFNGSIAVPSQQW